MVDIREQVDITIFIKNDKITLCSLVHLMRNILYV
jgi:hypothetical protein